MGVGGGGSAGAGEEMFLQQEMFQQAKHAKLCSDLLKALHLAALVFLFFSEGAP